MPRQAWPQHETARRYIPWMSHPTRRQGQLALRTPPYGLDWPHNAAASSHPGRFMVTYRLGRARPAYGFPMAMARTYGAASHCIPWMLHPKRSVSGLEFRTPPRGLDWLHNAEASTCPVAGVYQPCRLLLARTPVPAAIQLHTLDVASNALPKRVSASHTATWP